MSSSALKLIHCFHWWNFAWLLSVLSFPQYLLKCHTISINSVFFHYKRSKNDDLITYSIKDYYEMTNWKWCYLMSNKRKSCKNTIISKNISKNLLSLIRPHEVKTLKEKWRNNMISYWKETYTCLVSNHYPITTFIMIKRKEKENK